MRQKWVYWPQFLEDNVADHADIKRRTLELFKQLGKAQGDRYVYLRNQIATLNDGLAMLAANRYKSTPYPKDDLLQLSRIGLIKAVEKFDTELGFSFSSLAMRYCRGEIQHFLRDYERPVKHRIGLENHATVLKAVAEYKEQYGKPIDPALVAFYRFGMSAYEWEELDQYAGSKHFKSLDEGPADGDPYELPSRESLPIEERELMDLQAQWVGLKVSELPEKQRDVMMLAFWSE